MCNIYDAILVVALPLSMNLDNKHDHDDEELGLRAKRMAANMVPRIKESQNVHMSSKSV